MSNDSKRVTFSSLDPSQKNTLDAILNGSDNLHVVHGPPGTGKSQLVVSLLEGMASQGKKVLFVSQNTEALKVIERMIVKTQKDIGYATENKYLSLFDFCLMLYNSKHRQLKYLREQYSNISSKQLPMVDVALDNSNVEFNLRYTNLDHHANYGLDGDEIGFDELVRYFIKYVNQPIAPEPLRELQSINIRQVFSALEGYEQADYFHEYNKPKRELALLSPKKTNITLPDVRQGIHDIKNVINSVSGVWIDNFATKVDIDVLDYVNHLKEYSSLRQYFDAYKLQTENIDMHHIQKIFDELIEKSGRIDEKVSELEAKHTSVIESLPVEVKGISSDTDSILLGGPTLEKVSADINMAISEKDRIIELMNILSSKYPDLEYASVRDVQLGFSSEMTEIYLSAIKRTKERIGNKSIAGLQDEIGGLKKADVEQVVEAIERFSEKIDSMGAIKRMLASVPSILKQRFGIMLVGDFEKFKGGLLDVLKLLPLLMGDDDKVVDVIAKNNIQHVPLSKLNIKLPDSEKDLATELGLINELVRLLEMHDINLKDYTQTKNDTVVLHSSLCSLQELMNVPDNKKVFIGSSLDKIIESINVTIEAEKHQRNKELLENERRDLWNDAYNTYKELILGSESTDMFESRVIETRSYLGHKIDQIPKLLNAVELPGKDISLSINFESIEKVLQAASDTDNYSDEFFEMRTGSTMRDWLDNIMVLETYNNDNEVIAYARHNTSIVNIKNALGAANVRYVENVLSNDVSFNAFAARIVNALVGELFGRAKTNQKTHISTAELLKSYERHLKSKRALSYRNTLRDLHKETIGATKELSKQTTLQAAGKSTMEKFRHNTKTITEAFPIICATPKDIAKYIAPSKAIFDYVIFDEASQLLPGQALPSIYRAKKAVIIGDPHQMPPNLNASFSLVEQSEDEFDDLGESILDLVLKQPQRQHHLKVHYRSRYNKLFEPSRKAIYSKSGVEPIFEAELANGAPIDILDDLGDEIDEYGYDKNFAKICAAIEDYLADDEKADFCVLFTTGGVLQKFRSYLEEVGYEKHKDTSKLYDNDRILLSTVTNCQGIEGTYTVLYMHHYTRPGAMWFFKEQAGAYKRLNVSITRQREGLRLLLADPRSSWIAACDQKINSDSTGPNALLSAELMRSLLTNAGEQADETYLDRELGSNISSFDSPLTEQLYSKLIEHYGSKVGKTLKVYAEVGWNLVIPRGEGIDANERNVGFRIDLGIYSTVRKRFVLGIEMDGAMYHSGYEKEHSDYTRQKVLEAKGWDIYRIWSTNWLLDMEKEFRKLTEKIDKALTENV